jgi:NAD(P)-dependent dehydrogenase (short-subunit alcohol dehydrogenase family)
VYLVTGGSRGLGFAAAQALVADGARVLLSAPHESTGQPQQLAWRKTPGPVLPLGPSRITPILRLRGS